MQKNNQMVEEDEIDLLQLFKALWQHALAIILVTLIGGFLAFAVTFGFITPKYTATAMMYVNNSSFSFGSTSFSISTGELNAASSLVNVYSEILKSRTTLEEVIAEAGIPYKYEDLSEMIEVEDVSGTGIFSVAVESKSPIEAELIANTIAKVLPDRIADIVDGASVRIVDYAIVPAHRSSPSYVKNTAIGLIIGFLLSAAVVCLKDIFVTQADTTIHSADDLRNAYPEIPILATIPDMRKSAKSGYYYSDYYSSPEEPNPGKKGKKPFAAKASSAGKSEKKTEKKKPALTKPVASPKKEEK